MAIDAETIAAEPIAAEPISSGGGGGLNVAVVFSVDLGTGARTVTNGLDLSGEGGMVWSKSRANVQSYQLYDANRGATAKISSDLTAAETTDAQGVTAFNSTGFTLGTSVTGSAVSWSFRKAPNFFDVITYSGDSVAGREIPHNLGVAPGMVLVKDLSNTANWAVQHISRGGTKVLQLDGNSNELTQSDKWNNTDADENNVTLGTNTNVNISGDNYVMYVFAHDPSAGGVIQCGEYVGDANTPGPTIELGWKPQYIFIKKVTGGGSGGWAIFDTARGMSTGGGEATLQANVTNAEFSFDYIDLQETGFNVRSSDNLVNGTGSTYIYMAIREV